jgi:hypothetical protein
VVAPLVLWTAWKDHVKARLTGDEPHYLVMADSLVHDHDLDVANNYADPNGIQALFPGLRPDHAADTRGDGHLRPVQGIGMAFVLAPAVMKGTSNELAEFIWARRVMVFLSALLAGQLFLFLRALAPRPWWVAWLAWGAWCIALPIVGYSNQLYPEIPAALCSVIALRLARAAPNRWRELSVGVALAPLPWLSIRYAPLTLGFIAWAALRATPRPWRARVASAARVAAPVVVSLLGVAAWYLHAFGTLSLDKAYRVAGLPTNHDALTTYQRAFEPFLGPYGGLLVFAPVFLLGVVALGLVARRRPLVAAIVGFTVVAYMFGSAPFGFRGYALPGRMAIVLTPLLAAGVALILARFRAALVVFAVFVALGMVVTYESGQQPAYGGLYADGAQPATVLRPFSHVLPNLTLAPGIPGRRVRATADGPATLEPVGFRRAHYKVTASVTCACSQVGVQLTSQRDNFAPTHARTVEVAVVDGRASLPLDIEHSGTIVSARVVSPSDAYVRDLRVTATTRLQSLDDPVRSSIPTTIVWCLLLAGCGWLVWRRGRDYRDTEQPLPFKSSPKNLHAALLGAVVERLPVVQETEDGGAE